MKKTITILLTTLFMFSSATLWASHYFARGRRYYIAREYEKAKEMFLKELEIRKTGLTYYFLGEVEKRAANYEKSEEYFQEAVKLYLKKEYRKNAWWNLIIIAEQRGDYAQTIKYCIEMEKKVHHGDARAKAEKIINKTLWSDNKEAISHFKKGKRYEHRKNEELAIQEYRKARELDPKFIAPLFATGVIYYQKGENDKALSYILEVARAVPYYSEAGLIAGDIFFQKRDYTQAAFHLQNALDYGFLGKKTRYMLHLKKGTSYYRTGNYGEAEKDFKELLELGNNSMKLLTLLSATLIKQKKEDEALTYLLRLYKKNTSSRPLLMQIGTIYYRLSDKRYIRFFNSLYRSCSSESCISRYKSAFTILFNSLYEEKRYGESAKVFDSLDSSIFDYKERIIGGKAHYYSKNYDRVIEIYEKLSLKKEEAVILAASYIHAKREIKADEYIRSLAEQYGKNDLFMKHPVIGEKYQSFISGIHSPKEE